MKKNLLLLSFFVIAVISNAQNSIPNGDFESWIEATYDYPQNYPYTSNLEAFFNYKVPFNEIRTGDAYHGNYAVQLKTLAGVGDTSGGYFVNSPYTSGDLWHGGVPITEIPTGIRGYYKYNIASDDSGLVVVAFSKAGANIGTYMYPIGGIHSTYSLFNFTFEPALSEAPDSVLIGATSTDFFKENYIPGGILTIDSISLTGVTNQPDLLNGDFELWGSETVYGPTSWYSFEEGLARTTDAYEGNYAVELTTFLAINDNNIAIAREGQVSNGYYSSACDCMMGGHPFSNMKDTLVFYYKYAPTVGTDRAAVYLNFKKDGTDIGWAGDELLPEVNYTYHEIPFDIGTVPDSVLLNIGSTLYGNQSVSYVGAVLKIDEIFFKSQMLTTGVISKLENTDINIFPNPTSGPFSIQMAGESMNPEQGKIEIYNVTGQKILESEIINRNTPFDISEFPKGIYFIKIYDGQLIHTSRIVKR